ncbi:MAG: hypothetical protein ABL886_08255, partial [Rhodoglobus sp.]
EEVLPTVFAEAGVRFDDELAADALFVIGVRRLWTLIDGQYSVLDHSLRLMSDRGVPAVRFGQTTYSRNTGSFRQVRDLRNDLQALLRTLEILDLVVAPMREMVQELAVRRSNGR